MGENYNVINAKIMKMFIKTNFKDENKIKKMKNLYQNPIYICICWWSKIYRFLVKNWRTQEMCHVNCIFFGPFLGNVQLASIINKGYVQQILGRENIFDPPILDQLQKGPS